MSKHTITIEEMSRYTMSRTIASNSGEDSRKTLVVWVTLNPLGVIYRAYDHGRQCFEGHSLADAIEAYNAAQ